MTLGMSGVPTFFLNDTTLIPWTGDYATFRATLDKAITAPSAGTTRSS